MTSTDREGEVFLTARAVDGRVLIDVEDECTALGAAELETTIARFEKRKEPHSALGSSLDSARKAVEANSGTLVVRATPGKGCLYLIELPQAK